MPQGTFCPFHLAPALTLHYSVASPVTLRENVVKLTMISEYLASQVPRSVNADRMVGKRRADPGEKLGRGLAWRRLPRE